MRNNLQLLTFMANSNHLQIIKVSNVVLLSLDYYSSRSNFSFKLALTVSISPDGLAESFFIADSE